jgi:2-dehydropantoate 2-reductase
MEAQGDSSGYKPFSQTAEDRKGAALEGQDMETDRVSYSSEEDTPPATENLSAVDRQYATRPELPRRIHIIGTGSIGKLVAHSLRSLPQPPPVTLLFHRPLLIEEWEKSKKKITIHDDGYDVERDGFDVELAPQERIEYGVKLEEGTPSVYDAARSVDAKPYEVAKEIEKQQKENAGVGDESAGYKPFADDAGQADKRARYLRNYAQYISTEPIHNLIVTTKTPHTVPALSRIKDRLLPTSTICFLQNGMGIIDEMNEKLFPNPSTRPNYAQGIITHGANVPPEKYAQDPFYAVHAGHGTIALGLLPRESPPEKPDSPPSTGTTGDEAEAARKKTWKWAPSSRYLVRTLTRSPVLCAVGFTPTELLQQQLEKLVVNCVINPLTSILDARNGSLLYNFALSRTVRLLLAEISLVINALPELQGVPNLNTRFAPERLESLVFSMANKTKDNVSSMLADVRAGRETEIQYINGYIVRRGEEMGMKCVVNYAIMQTVIGKAQLVHYERRGEVPDQSSRGQEGSM